MSTWKGKSRGSVQGYRFAVFIFRNFGLSITYLGIRFTALYFVFFSPEAFKSIYFYFNKILGYSKLKSFLGVYNNFYVFGQTIIDKIVLFSGSGKYFTYHFDGVEHLNKMAKDGKGGILISAHLGNWDVAGHFLGELDTVINIVMFEAERENLKKYFEKLEVRKTLKIIEVKQDMSHVFEISNALRNHELVCMHGDRFVEGSRVVNVDFFNRPVKLPKGVFQIATKLKVPYSYVFALKESNTHYHFYATPGKVNQGTITDLASEFALHLEKMVLKYPTQWFNHYEFWRNTDKAKDR